MFKSHQKESRPQAAQTNASANRLLLSALKDPDITGLQPVNPNPDESFYSLGNGKIPLQRIVDKLSGHCTRRESIPSVLAQEELFRLCVQQYGEKGADDDKVERLCAEMTGHVDSLERLSAYLPLVCDKLEIL